MLAAVLQGAQASEAAALLEALQGVLARLHIVGLAALAAVLLPLVVHVLVLQAGPGLRVAPVAAPVAEAVEATFASLSFAVAFVRTLAAVALPGVLASAPALVGVAFGIAPEAALRLFALVAGLLAEASAPDHAVENLGVPLLLVILLAAPPPLLILVHLVDVHRLELVAESAPLPLETTSSRTRLCVISRVASSR